MTDKSEPTPDTPPHDPSEAQNNPPQPPVHVSGDACPAADRGPTDAEAMKDALQRWGLPAVLHSVHHELELFGRAHKYDWVSARLLVLRNVIIASGIVIAALAIAAITWKELNKEVLVINSFDVPPALQERGYSSRVVGRMLFDQITAIRTRTLARVPKRELTSPVWKAEPDVAIPDTKFTLGSVFAYLRSLTGRDTYVDGELVMEGNDLKITIRQRGRPARTARAPATELQELILKAAEYVVLETQPALAAVYFNNKEDRVNALEAAKVAAESANRTEAAIGLNEWSRALREPHQQAAAQEKLWESVDKDPQATTAWRALWSRAVQTGGPVLAIETLEQILVRAPALVEAWQMLATQYEIQGQHAKAEQAAERARKLDPDNWAVLLQGRARKLVMDGDAREALAIAERVEREATADNIARGRYEAQAMQVDALIALREWENALAVSDRMLEANIRSPQSLRARAAILLEMHDYDAAIEASRKAQAIGTLADFELVQALVVKGSYREAQEIALRREHYRAPMHEWLIGQVHAAQSQWTEALARYDNALKLDATHYNALLGRGRALAATGRHAEAEKSFDAAITLRPKRSQAYYEKGKWLADRGDAAATELLQKAAALDPKWAMPHAALGERVIAQGKVDEGKALIAKALKLEPKNPALLRLRP